jgi:asparagine synthase (glutamine-hydrolysing)
MLSEAIDDLLPRELLQRPKMGFTLPFERWIQSRLRREISNVLENETCVAATGLNAQKAASIWRRFLQSPRSVGWSRPWALFVLAKWCAINGVRFANYATYSAVP